MNEHGHHRLSRILQLGQEGKLVSRQLQAAGVHVLSAIHGGHVLGLEGAVVVELTASKAAGGAAQHRHNYIRLPGRLHRLFHQIRI